MGTQPGNRFRFRLRARVVHASEAVRDDSAVAGVHQTFFCCCCSSCCSCWRADVPGRPAGRPTGRPAGRPTRQEKKFSTSNEFVMIDDFCRRFSETEEKFRASNVFVMIYDFYRSKIVAGRPPANSRSSSRSSSSRRRKKFGGPQPQRNHRAQLRSHARHVHEDETEIDFPVGVAKGLTHPNLQFDILLNRKT